MPQIIEDQDIIDQYDHVAEPFFAKVLDMDYGAYLLTDESTLSDFSMANLPDEMVPAKASYRELRTIWDKYVASRIHECFGIEVSSTVVRLVDLFQRIDESHKTRILH